MSLCVYIGVVGWWQSPERLSLALQVQLLRERTEV